MGSEKVRLQVKERRQRRLDALKEADRHLPISFAIIGLQKAATTTLYRMVTKHPWIAGGPEKEMRFFYEDWHNWDEPDYSNYARPAVSEQQRIAGDATPEYLFWPNALERMYRYNPQMRLIVSFRDPLERAYSAWSMERSRDPEFPDLLFAIREWVEPTLPQRVPDGWTPYDLRRQSMFTRGLYGQQMRRALSIFPREQFLFYDFKDIYTSPRKALKRFTRHVGVRPFRRLPEMEHLARTRGDHTGAAPTPADLARVIELYREDLPEFSELTEIDMRDWPTWRVIKGELAVEELAGRLAAKVGLPPPV